MNEPIVDFILGGDLSDPSYKAAVITSSRHREQLLRLCSSDSRSDGAKLLHHRGEIVFRSGARLMFFTPQFSDSGRGCEFNRVGFYLSAGMTEKEYRDCLVVAEHTARLGERMVRL